MGIIFYSGFETGDFSEWLGFLGGSSGNAPTIDTAIVNTYGNYSMKAGWTGVNSSEFGILFTDKSTLYARAWVYSTAAGGATVGEILAFGIGGTDIISVRLVTDGAGGQVLRLWNDNTVSQVGSDFSISSSTWYRVELSAFASASVGTAEMKVNGIVRATGTGLNINASQFHAWVVGNNYISGSGATGNVWIDDFMLRDDAYPGPGYVIARQFNTTVPNYNAWTKSTGSIWNVWDDTPFNAATNATDASNNVDKQTAVVDFTTVGGTGNTGFGPGVVAAADTINAFKVSTITKTSSTSTDGMDTAIFRTPAGGGGSDTTGTFGPSAALTTSDSYYEFILASAPTTAQVMNCEVGILKGTGTNTHTVEAMWAMIDWVPAPSAPNLSIGVNYVEDWQVDY